MRASGKGLQRGRISRRARMPNCTVSRLRAFPSLDGLNVAGGNIRKMVVAIMHVSGRGRRHGKARRGGSAGRGVRGLIPLRTQTERSTVCGQVGMGRHPIHSTAPRESCCRQTGADAAHALRRNCRDGGIEGTPGDLASTLASPASPAARLLIHLPLLMCHSHQTDRVGPRWSAGALGWQRRKVWGRPWRSLSLSLTLHQKHS